MPLTNEYNPDYIQARISHKKKTFFLAKIYDSQDKFSKGAKQLAKKKSV